MQPETGLLTLVNAMPSKTDKSSAMFANDNAFPLYSGSSLRRLPTDESGNFRMLKLFPKTGSGNNNFLLFISKLKEAVEGHGVAAPKLLRNGIMKGQPFMEIAFVDGPCLDKLLKEKATPFFTIEETIAIVEQVAHTLAHCHNLGLVHGGVKPASIRYSRTNGKFILVGFGSQVLLPADRIAALSTAGEKEYAAPEQTEGGLSPATDVYRLGMLLYYLLTGTVPAPSQKEEAENETFESNIIALRNATLRGLPEAPKTNETAVPSWLISLIVKCLQVAPSARFANAGELYDFILQHQTFSLKKHTWYRSAPQTANVQKETVRISIADKLKQWILPLPKLKFQKLSNVNWLQVVSVFFAAAAIGGLLLSAKQKREMPLVVMQPNIIGQLQEPVNQVAERNNSVAIATSTKKDVIPNVIALPGKDAVLLSKETISTDKAGQKPKMPRGVTGVTKNNLSGLGSYKVRSRAHFYDRPDEDTRREAFVVHWNNAVLHALEEKNEFIYIIFTNWKNETSKGWLRKKDLVKLNENLEQKVQ